MPQASDALRDEWKDDTTALNFLDGRGVREVRNGMLLLPKGIALTDRDWRAITYLMDEWDFDYVRD